jgi:hypothetical protein
MIRIRNKRLIWCYIFNWEGKEKNRSFWTCFILCQTPLYTTAPHQECASNFHFAFLVLLLRRKSSPLWILPQQPLPRTKGTNHEHIYIVDICYFLHVGRVQEKRTVLTFVVLVLVWMVLHCFSPKSILECTPYEGSKQAERWILKSFTSLTGHKIMQNRHSLFPVDYWTLKFQSSRVAQLKK